MKRTPLKPSTTPLKRTPLKPGRTKLKSKGDPPELVRNRRIVWERDRGMCRRCGAPGAHVHHRNRRRGPDPHALEHLVLCCLSCHDWIHAHTREARAEGWLD